MNLETRLQKLEARRAARRTDAPVLELGQFLAQDAEGFAKWEAQAREHNARANDHNQKEIDP